MPYAQYNSYRQSYEFVRDKFFSFSGPEFARFARFYSSRYGESAGSYLWKTYSCWKAGITSMSGQTHIRILECVPRFLSRRDQIALLRFYLPWMQTLREADFPSAPITSDFLVDAYEETVRYVLERDFKLGWFIGEIFSEEEISEFLHAFKFMLLKRLEASYQCVCRDIERLSDFVGGMDFPVSVDYQIHYLGRSLNLPAANAPDPDAFRITQPIPSLFQTTDEDLLNVLSEDAAQMQREQEDAAVNAFVTANDVQIALSQIKAATSQEIESTLKANGEGGRIVLHFVRRDVQRMRYEVAKSGWIFTGVCVLLSGLYFHGLNHGYLGMLVFPGGFFAIWLLASLWGAYLDSKRKLEDYERRKAARFAEG